MLKLVRLSSQASPLYRVRGVAIGIVVADYQQAANYLYAVCGTATTALGDAGARSMVSKVRLLWCMA